MGRNMVGRGGGPDSVRRHGARCSVDQSSVILWNLDPILKTIKPVLFLSFSNMPGNMIWLKETWFNIIIIARLTSEHYSLAVVLQVRSLAQQHSIIWQLVWNWILRPHPDLMNQKLLGGVQGSVFYEALWWLKCMVRWRTTAKSHLPLDLELYSIRDDWSPLTFENINCLSRKSLHTHCLMCPDSHLGSHTASSLLSCFQPLKSTLWSFHWATIPRSRRFGRASWEKGQNSGMRYLVDFCQLL